MTKKIDKEKKEMAYKILVYGNSSVTKIEGFEEMTWEDVKDCYGVDIIDEYKTFSAGKTIKKKPKEPKGKVTAESVVKEIREETVEHIDYMLSRHYDLSIKSEKGEKLTQMEERELRGYGIKISLFMVGGCMLSGMNKEGYMSLTKEDWGDEAQKQIKAGTREYKE